MGELRGAVERIVMPAEFRTGSALTPGSLFGSNGMLGKILGQPLDDKAFGALVRLRDEIHLVAFVGDVQRPGQFVDQNASGFPGNFNGGLDVSSWQGGYSQVSGVLPVAAGQRL